MDFHYYIDLDERGEFYASVRDDNDNSVFNIIGFDIFEDGFMEHSEDIAGLKDYLTDLGYMTKHDTLWMGE